MAPTAFTITPMTEADLPAAIQLTTESFQVMLKKLLGQVPPGRTEGDRVAKRFFHPTAKSLVLRDENGVIQGTGVVLLYGTRALAGPVCVSPQFRASNASRELVQGIMGAARDNGCRAMDASTPAQSAQHLLFHFRRGSEPVYPTPWMMRPVNAPPVPKVWDSSNIVVTRYSALPEPQRQAALADMRRITGTFDSGYDVSAEAQHLLAQRIGETYLAALDGRTIGFAAAHRGPGSEAFQDQEVLVKFLFVDTRIALASASSAFHGLLDTIEEDARTGGFELVTASVSGGRRASVSAILDRGYQPLVIFTEYVDDFTAPELHARRPATGFAAPSQFALIELR